MILQIEYVQTNQLSGKLLAKAVTSAYQDHMLPSSPEPLGISIEKNCLNGMIECLMGNKSPVDFFNVQKQVSYVFAIFNWCLIFFYYSGQHNVISVLLNSLIPID